jgi:hypothetical protein
MLSGTLTVTLRPLRLAFVVAPGDTKAIFEAVRINSYLWGGQYNPIIPLFRKLPAWLPRLNRPDSATGLFKNYLDLFDPDFVIRVGSVRDVAIDIGTLKEVSLDEIQRPIAEYDEPSYGIGLFEILDHLLNEEFRFVRRDSLHLRIPDFGNDLFLASVFGTFPDKFPRNIAKGLKESWSYTEAPCTRANYFEFLDASNLFARRICNHDIKMRKRSWWWGEYVFLMDANDANDILLYWNYRALGWTILPVPSQAAKNEALEKYVAAFIENNYWPLRSNSSIYNHTTVLGSPNVTEQQLKELVVSLNLKPVAQDKHFKTSICSWLPRFWDEWARSKDGAERGVVRADEKRIPVRSDNNQFEFEPLMPAFAREFGGQGTPRCANQLELSVYSDRHEYAMVIPPGGDKLAHAAHFGGIDEIRCSNDGLVFFPKFTRWTKTMTAPAAETIFKAWFAERGWQISTSDKGSITKQLVRQIGGLWRVNWLTEESVLRFLTEIPRSGPISDSDFRARLSRLSKSCGRFQAEQLAKWLVESNIVKLGIDVCCPKCLQRSWYSVTEANYELVCRQCLESYRLPAETLKKMPWAYRGAGAFGSRLEVVVVQEPLARTGDGPPSEQISDEVTTVRAKVPDGLQGGLSVLLLLHLLSRDMHPSITPLLSFNASKGDEHLEVDLGLFTRHIRSGLNQDDVVFAECKSFHGRFTERDVQRMEKFARDFPGAVVVFATLRRELDAKEKRLLIPFVNRGRRLLTTTRPNNPVVIFTANELFSWTGPRSAWKELGPPFSHHADEYGDDRVFVSLADATQQLYLGLPSIHTQPVKRFRRREKSNSQPRPKSLPE